MTSEIAQKVADIHETCDLMVANERRRRAAAEAFFAHQQGCSSCDMATEVFCEEGNSLLARMLKLWKGWAI